MPGQPKFLINRGSYGAGFKYLEDIEKTFGKGYSDADEREIRMLQAEVRLATGKRKEAADIFGRFDKQATTGRRCPHPLCQVSHGGTGLRQGSPTLRAGCKIT